MGCNPRLGAGHDDEEAPNPPGNSFFSTRMSGIGKSTRLTQATEDRRSNKLSGWFAMPESMSRYSNESSIPDDQQADDEEEHEEKKDEEEEFRWVEAGDIEEEDATRVNPWLDGAQNLPSVELGSMVF